MPEWWTYSPQDFLMFSPRAYLRLLERHHQALWPLQVAALALGAAIPLLLRRQRDRAAAIVLAACWLWVAWSFLLSRFATINWAAPWFAGLFAVEAVLLVALAPRFRFAWHRAGFALFAFALLVQPWLGWLAGRSWGQVELFAITPDPTALGTLGLLLLVTPGWRRRLLLPVPLLWCAVGVATSWAMAVQ